MRTKSLHSLTLGIIILLMTASCVDEKKSTETENNVTGVEYQPSFKIILIDASGSFINERPAGKDESLFDISCKQIIQEHLKNSGIGERIIVRSIQSNSYGSNSIICDIDFSSKELNFDKQKPNDAGELVNWKRELKRHNNRNQPKIDSIRNHEIEKFQKFYDTYRVKGFNKTDLCGALENIPLDLEQIDSSFARKTLLIYSDLQNTTSLSRCSSFNAEGLIIKAFYVNDNDKNPDEYIAFRENTIKTYFKNAKSVNLFNPAHSKNK